MSEIFVEGIEMPKVFQAISKDNLEYLMKVRLPLYAEKNPKLFAQNHGVKDGFFYSDGCADFCHRQVGIPGKSPVVPFINASVDENLASAYQAFTFFYHSAHRADGSWVQIFLKFKKLEGEVKAVSDCCLRVYPGPCPSLDLQEELAKMEDWEKAVCRRVIKLAYERTAFAEEKEIITQGKKYLLGFFD